MSLEFNTALRMAEAMYNAYSASTNNKNFLGEEMPKWSDLRESIKNAWVASAQAAYENSWELLKSGFIKAFTYKTARDIEKAVSLAIYNEHKTSRLRSALDREPLSGVSKRIPPTDLDDLFTTIDAVIQAETAEDLANIVFHGAFYPESPECSEVYVGQGSAHGESVPCP